MKQKRILCIGNSVLDQVYTVPRLPKEPGKNFATAFLEVGGGPAATGSVAVARLGHYAKLWSRIGDDAAADSIQKELRHYGVDTGGMYRAPGVVSPIAAVIVDGEGERTIVCFNDKNLPLDAHWLPLDEVASFDCVLGDVRWARGVAETFTKAAACGVPTVFDGDLCPDEEDIRTLAALAGHAIFSESGLRQCSGESDPEAGLKKVAAAISGVPYVTMGDKGCLWMEDGALRHIPAFRVKVVDTTGAGDVFHGAFAVALAEGRKGGDALRFASGAAALKCTVPGGRAGIPDRPALDKFLAEN